MTLHLATQALMARPERALAERAPQIILSRSRRFCSSCMVRKTYWLVKLGEFSKHRRCWSCFSPEERRVFRLGY